MHFNFSKRFFIIFIFLGIQFFWGQTPVGITTSVGDTTNITICEGDSVTFTLDPVSGSSSGYIFHRIRAGIDNTVQFNSPNNTFTTSSIEDGDIYYGERFDYDYSSAPILTSSITFTVQTVSGSDFTGGTIDQADRFVCLGIPGINLTVSGGPTGSNYLFQWQQSTDGGVTFTNIPAAISEAYNTGVINATTHFRRRVVYNGSGTCERFSTVFVNAVSDLNPGQLDTNIPTNICYNTSPGTLGIGGSVIAFASRGTIDYQWQQNVNGLGWQDIAGEIQSYYTPPNLTQDMEYRRLAINTEMGLGECSLSTNNISITVENQVFPGTISGGDQTICNGELPATMQLVGATTGPNIGHQWQHSTDGVNFNDIPGATETLLTFTSTATFIPQYTTYYRVKTGTLTPSCNEFSSVTTVTVLPENVQFTSSAINGVYCTGDDITFYMTGDNSSFSLLQDGIVPLVTNTSSTTYTLSGLTGNHYITFRAETPSECTRTIRLDLIENTIDAGSISGDQLLCSGILPQQVTSVVSATINNGTTDIDTVLTANYQWQSSIDDLTWINVANANQATYTPPSNLTTSVYLRRMAQSTINGTTCEDFSNAVFVNVISSLLGGNITPSEQTLCSSATAAPLTVNGGSIENDLLYQWEEAVYPGGVFTPIPAATQASYTPGNVSVPMQYRRKVYSSTSSSCSAYSTLHVLTPLDLNPGSLDPSQNSAVFYNTAPLPIGSGLNGSDASSSNAGISYQWEQSIDEGTNWTSISVATGVSYAPPPLMRNTLFRRRAIASFNGNSCSAVTNSIRISITNLLNAGRVSQDQVLCNQFLPNDLVLTGAVSGTSIEYQWEMSTDNFLTDITTISNTTTRLSFTATPTWNPVEDVTYFRVRVYDTNSGNTAFSVPASITLLPLDIGLTSDAEGNTFCIGDDISFFATGSGSITYEFLINGISYQGPSSANTYMHPNLSATSTFTLIASLPNGCSRQIDLFLMANYATAGTIYGTQIICNGEIPSPIVSLTPGTALGVNVASSTTGSYQWQSSFNGTTSWTNILNADQEDYSNPGPLIRTTYFRRLTKSTLNGIICWDISNTVEVSVFEILNRGTIDQPDQIICEGEQPVRLTVSGGNVGAGIVYQWEQAVGTVTTVFTTMPLETGVDFIPPPITQTMRYRRKTRSVPGGCIEYSNVHTIWVNDIDAGVLDPNQNTAICYGSSIPILNSGPNGQDAHSNLGVISYQWQQSPNGGVWTNIPAATSVFHQPSLTMNDMWYRRVAFSTVSASVCSEVTNPILIEVQPAIDVGLVASSQRICEGSVFEDLSIVNTAPPPSTTYSYQWQQSTDNVNFTDIPGANNLVLPGWQLYDDTYFRCLVVASGAVNCEDASASLFIDTDPVHTLIQDNGNPNQAVCSDTPIVPIVLRYGGGAAGVDFSNLSASGLMISHDRINQTYTISGIPSDTLSFSAVTTPVTGNVCSLERIDFQIDVYEAPALPDQIYLDGRLIVNNQTQIAFPPLCYGTPSSQFTALYSNPFEDGVSQVYWELVSPLTAGSIDGFTGVMTWNIGFSGVATFRARGQSNCDSNTLTPDFIDFQITIENQQIPPIAPQTIGPIIIGTISLYGGLDSGGDPTCPITVETPDTLYQVESLTASNTVASTGIVWTMEVISVGNPNVSTAGTIDPDLGLVDWNPGFWGVVNIYADPTNCNGANDPRYGPIDRSLRQIRTVNIPGPISPFVDIHLASNNSLPNCPAETSGFITQFYSNLSRTQSVTWYINNTNAGSIDSQTGVLTWAPNFSGRLDVIAQTAVASDPLSICETAEGRILIDIPAEPNITLQSGFNSNIVETCVNTQITPIQYELKGAVSGVFATGLPTGIAGNFSSTPQITTIELSGISQGASEVYVVSLPLQNYSYTTQVAGESANSIVQNLAQLINASDPTVRARVNGSNLILTAYSGGVPFSFNFESSGTNPQISVVSTTTVDAENIFEISGSTNVSAGTYSYTLTASSTSTICPMAVSEGVITVRSESTIMLLTANDNQEVCNNTSIQDMVYEIGNAQNAYVAPATPVFLRTDGLPNGVSANYFGGRLIISGTPNVSLTESTTFTFTIHTTNNIYGCEETLLTGSIVVLPDIEISLISPPGTQHQQVCEGTNIEQAIYQLSSFPNPNTNNFTYDFNGLPRGVGGIYDTGLRRLIVTGTPELDPSVTVPTVFEYSITVSGCLAMQTVSGTITVYPEPTLYLISNEDTDNQVICDDEGIETIRYQIDGATGYDWSISPAAPWVSFLHDPSSQQAIIGGTPNFEVDQETVYTYTINPVSSPFNCTSSPRTTGTITLLPKQKLEVTSDPSTLDQIICNGAEIEAILLTFNEQVLGATVAGLPTGLTVDTRHYNQIYSMQLSGGNSPAGVTYGIKINSNQYTLTTTATISANHLATALTQLIGSDPAITASDDGSGNIVLTALTQGVPFRVTTSESPSFFATFSNKQVVQSHGELLISGVPLSSNSSATTYNYTVATTGTNCSSTTIEGSIRVEPVPEVNLISAVNSDRQILCSGSSIIPIEYEIIGTIFSVSINGLPPGIQGNYNSVTQQFQITGAPTINNFIPTNYEYTLNIIANPGLCDPIQIMGQIIVNPFERFELISALGTDDQDVCNHQPLIDIEYELSGNISQVMMVSGAYPNGITGTKISQNQIVEIAVTGPVTAAVSESFSLQINNTPPIVYESTSAGITKEMIARALVNLINPNPIVTASENNDGIIRLEANTAGNYFTAMIRNGSFNQPMLQIPTEIKSNLLYVISGTPSLSLASSQQYTYELETQGGLCASASVSGSITVNPDSKIILLSPLSTAAQTVCDLSPISNIVYQVSQGATGASISWAPYTPNGITTRYDASTDRFYIEGTPNIQTNSTLFSYTINTTGNRLGCDEDRISGTLMVNAKDQIQLVSGIGTDNQRLCGSSTGVNIQNIVYQLTGTASSIFVTGLPSGVVSNYDSITKRLTISGVVNAVSSPTFYNYTVSSGSSLCPSDLVTGTFAIDVLPELVLTSSLGSINQVGVNAVCEGNDIEPITYEIGTGVTTVTINGLPNGLEYVISGTTLRVYGKLNTGITSSQVFSYNILVGNNNGCLPPSSSMGRIEVIPIPVINASYIINNDINHISCNGANDGAINIPSLSPAFDLRISGNQNSIRQIDHVTLVNNPLLSDVYQISINGTLYSHTVIPSSFGGAVQTVNEVIQELIDEINFANGTGDPAVSATLFGSDTIVLTSKTPGLAFTVDQVSISSSGGGSALISNTTLQQNKTIAYDFSWTGPNGFTSSSLAISNLEAGAYYLTVSINYCISDTATFTLEEPDPLVIDTQVCNGSFIAEVEGGVAPYTFILYDHNGMVLETNISNGANTFLNVTPGANYRLEVKDSQCAVASQIAVEIPFELNYNAAIPRLINDFCNDAVGEGSIELGGNALGEAFSGGSNQFTYSWIGSNFTANTRDIYNLQPGIYTVTVTDAVLGCSQQEVFEILSVNPITINPTSNTIFNAQQKIELACSGDETGLIEVSVTGGNQNYSYSWTRNGNTISGQNQARIENLGVGVYEVSVSDSPPIGAPTGIQPCVATRSFEVVTPQALSFSVNTGNTSSTYCQDQSTTAQFDIEIFGGTPPFNVIVLGEDGTRSTHKVSDRKKTIAGLTPSLNGNTYTVKITDANQCETNAASSTITFQSVDAVQIRYQVTQIDCNQGKLGSIQLNVVDGTITNPEQVQVEWISANQHIYDTWSNGKGKLENIENGGTYQVIVTQGNCVLFREDRIQVTDVDNQVLFISDVAIQAGGCNGEKGRIALEIMGGTPPIKIDWEQYKAVTSQTTSGSMVVSSTTRIDWVNLPQYANNAIIDGLDVGTYRARVTDASSDISGFCGGPQLTNSIIIGSNAFELANFRLDQSKSCNSSSSSSTAQIYFSVLNTLDDNNNEYTPKILLDGINPGSNLVALGSDNYRIINIDEGSHTLNIETGTSTAVLGSFSNCTISHPFEVEFSIPIRYAGETVFETDTCNKVTELAIDVNQITGGVPYIINGAVSYDYYWEYTPENQSDGIQTYVGETIYDALPGSYKLTISDSQNCSSDIIEFFVTGSDGSLPFAVAGALQQSTAVGSETVTSLVKALPPNCLSAQSNGQIGVTIEGGLKPYTIEWYKESVTSGTISTSSTNEFVKIDNATNSTHLRNLESGKYKLLIQSQNQECPQSTITDSNNYYEEIIIVPKNEQLYIIDGPEVDEDLCQGLSGRIYIEIFDNLQKGLTFYYNNEIVNLAEDQPSKEGAYILLISEPQKEANLLITNSEGCSVSKVVKITDIGAPDFKYTSPAFEADGSVSAREEVTFSNTSELPYSYSEWNFGDGSAGERVVGSYTLSPTLHTFGISGTYFVTLRNFNDLGCYEEITKQIVVGKGYNVLIPNAFSPNGDRINDTFRPLFSGFGKVIFNVYDNYGNQLYEEVIEEPDTEIISGIELKGWEGFNANDAPYYIYRFVGNLLSDGTEIERSGTFVLFK